MNDHHHACESWSEQTSLAAAGCLPAGEEAELHRQLAACPECRERYRQLAGLCEALAELREPARGVEDVVVQRAMSAISPSALRRPGVRRAWLWTAVAAVAAGLLLAMALRWSEVRQPQRPADQRNVARARDAAPKAAAPDVSAASRPPTLLDYDCAIAQSDDAPERLLSQDARRIGVLFDRTRTLTLTTNDVELMP